MSEDQPPVAPPQGDERAGVLRTLRELPPPVLALLCGTAVNRMGSFVSLFLVLYVTGLGFRPAEAGGALTAFGLGSIAGVVAGGAATDRFGARNVIVTSMALSGVGVGTVGFVTGYLPLLGISLAIGAVTQLYRPASTTMLSELTPPRRLVITTAASRLGLNVGATLAPLLGVWLAGFGYRAVFLADAITSVVFAVAAMVVLPGGRPGREAAHAVRHGDRERGGYRAVLRDRRYLLVLAAMFATAFAEVQYQAVLPLEIRDRGLPTAVYGAVVALNGALVILLELPLTPYVQRLPMRTAISVGTLLIGGGLALFGVTAGVWLLFAAALVWTMGEIVSAPSSNAYPALAAPGHLRSRYIGAFAACHTIGYAVGPAVGTALFQYDGALVWLMCAGLGVAGFSAMWFGVRTPPHEIAPAARATPCPATDLN
ncbi:MFS transporter [Microbispora amethystogenes]|uniref:MFS transporter n=1 Tax=Microbispora amethystogenes TaxID=1427754 RepID=UPI0033E5A975